jgi:hypothetical protein
VSFLRGLLAARGHLAFLAGLALAFATIRAVEAWSRPRLARGAASMAALDRLLPLRPVAGSLDDREQAMARAAWSYLESNVDPVTGLVTSVKGHPATTMWDLGSQLWAVVAAEDLGLVSARGASSRLGRALASLARLPLDEGGLPSKSYDTRTLAMVNYDGRAAPRGLGWSALDVARVLAPLSVVAWRHPEHAATIRRVVSRWRLADLTDGASLRGTSRGADGVLQHHQEGRLGYEQLAAKDLLAWGLPVGAVVDYTAHLAFTDVYGVPVPRDDRLPRDHGGARAPVLSEPWILDALEDGLDAVTLSAARAVLLVQARRFAATRRLTAVSEDHLDRPPWFAYSSVLDGDDAWSARDSVGRPAPDAFGLSAKAAVGWGVLFEGEYPEQLLEAAAALVVPGEGLWAGRYDDGRPNRVLSLNTNAVVLEALAYRVRGPARAAAWSPALAREAGP